MRRYNFSYPIALALLILSTPTARAQDTDNKDKADIVVTANGSESRRSETGQAIGIIDQNAIETSQIANIADLLRSVPSVAAARSGGIGNQTSIFIRGAEASQTLVLIDGVRINDPSSPNAAFDFGALLTGNIDRVEILRGPNSVIWGSQAIGGVINIRNAEPGPGFTARGLAEYGSFDTAQLRANVTAGRGIASASLGGGYYRTDGISALRAGQERDGYENYSANGKLKLRFSGALTLDLRGYYNNGRVEFDDPFAAAPDSFPVTRNEQFIGYAGLNSQLLSGRLQQRLAYSHTDIRRIGEEPGVPLSFNVNALRGALDRIEYFGSFAISNGVNLVAGAEYERSFASSFFPADGSSGPNSAATQVFSVFGQLSLRPLAGLTLTGGARQDDYSQYGGQTSLGGNFAYTPNEGKTILRGTYAEGFRAPTLTEALLPFGNRGLRPETAKSFDIGAEHHFWADKIILSAAYFRRRSNDTIVFSPATFQSENIARTRAQGLELGLALRPAPGVTIDAHYALVDARTRSPDANFGNRLARRPKDSASLSADWQRGANFSVGGSLVLTGGSFDDIANETRLAGYILASLRASYQLNRRLELLGRIENLTDADHETIRGFGTLGRNAYIGLRVKY